MDNESNIIFKSQNVDVSPRLLKILTAETVHLQGTWKGNSISGLAPFIDKWKVKDLKIQSNYYPQILQEIRQIDFPLLQSLYIWENNIESLEGITRIYMPQLQSLSMGYNKVITFKEMKKDFWPNLSGIYVCTYMHYKAQNLLVNAYQVTKLRSSKFKEMKIQYSVDYTKQEEDVRWVVKAKTKILNLFSTEYLI